MTEVLTSNGSLPAPQLELYRGVILPQEAVTDEFLTAPLVPGTRKVNEHGELVVADGNEYGVYMTDNDEMARSVYSNPRYGRSINCGLEFRYHGSLRMPERPTVGVLYAISTHGLQVRPPKINGPMKGHYNNGFGGREWIADEIPPENYQVLRLTLGPGTVSRSEYFPVHDGDVNGAMSKLRDRAMEHDGRLGALMADLWQMSAAQRLNEFRVNSLVRTHAAPIV